MVFLPFVSDFAGGYSGQLFMWGMTSAAVLLTPSWFDYYHAIKVGLNTNCWYWACLGRLLPTVGVVNSLSVIGVALNPWNERLALHLLFANGIFFGGAVFIATDSLLGYARGRSFKRVLFVAAVAFSSLLLMFGFLRMGSSRLKKQRLKFSFKMMGTDFNGFCTGAAGSIHADGNINVAAMFEWMLLASVALACFAKLHIELHVFPRSTRQVANPVHIATGGASYLLQTGK